MATVCIGNSNDNTGSVVYVPKNATQHVYLPLITALTDSNSIISLLFGQKQSVEWDQFKSGIVFHLRAKDEDVENLRAILSAELGCLEKAHFAKFLRWFSPLVPETDSMNKTVWKISSVAKLIRQPWFHGFTLDTSKRLKTSSEGTFLVRFGCQAPHFVLALKDKSTETVMEWRVLATSGSVRLNDTEKFQDLEKLVENYTTSVPCGASCALVRACV
jgi:hypothetical protein